MIENHEAMQRIIDTFGGAPAGVEHHARDGSLGFGLVQYALVRLHRPQRALAIGSRKGFIPACLALALRENGAGRLDFVDANYANKEHGAHVAWGGQAHWTGDAAADFPGLAEIVDVHLLRTDEFFPTCPHRYGYISIDGAHDAAAVKHDFEAAASRLVPGGLITLHDALVAPKHKFGVRTFLASLASEWKQITLGPWPGLAIVQQANCQKAN